ncbi:Alpha/Beta hydrolase protein [Phyllosticta citriasiana]|uniref:Alpha/Beta hydrolase protein n=1 Tax=Phyllosticta citriasiana TaxID=595635 RepID=UPI0030FD54C9
MCRGVSSLDASKFDPKAISRQTIELNEVCEAKSEAAPSWHEVPKAHHPRIRNRAARYREMRRNGEGSLPKVVVLESGVDFKIPSRDAGREIPCRLFKPEDGQVKGVMMHLHGGGWVLQGEDWNDELLRWMADNSALLSSALGIVRLAPEHPYPSGPEDCIDAAESKITYGADLKFIGGESAGAHLSVVTALHLHKIRPRFALQACNFALQNLITDRPNIELCIHTFLPNYTIEQRRDPCISPFYARLSRGALPPALFIVGAEDPLVDDSIMMAAKCHMSGNEAVLKLCLGAPHGFTFHPYSDAATSLEDERTFVSRDEVGI